MEESDINSNNVTSYEGTTHSNVTAFNWNLCIFCQNKSDKMQLHSMTELPTSDFVKENAKCNLRLSIALSTVSDCLAAESMYHLPCYSKFKRLANKSGQEEKNVDYAMLYIIDELNTAASQGDMILLDAVWNRYEQYVDMYNTQLTGKYKDKHTFGICLRNKINKMYNFFNNLNNNDTYMFPINHFEEGISSIINQNEKELDESIIPKFHPQNENEFLDLVHVALRLRGEIMEKTGYQGMSVTEDAAVGCIPENLYLFLNILFGGQDIIERDDDDDEIFKGGTWTKNFIMSIAQDIIFGLGKGKKLTPKHIGLTSTLHQKTRSKDLVNLFYHAGHCLSYKSLLKMDATLAEYTLRYVEENTGAVIPQNLVSGRFIHFSTDNIDIRDESLDGKNIFNATQMAAYQRSDNENILPFSDINKFSKNQTLQVPEVLTKIEKVLIKNDKLSPTIRYPVNADSLKSSETVDSHIKAKSADNTFYLFRQDMEKRIGWTEFNQQDNQICSSETTIGHMPMILNPAHEYDTLNLVVRRCLAISNHFGQEYTIITVDQALFCKLHTLISNIPEFQHKVFPRLGGLHISLNFQRIIGQHMSSCDLNDA